MTEAERKSPEYQLPISVDSKNQRFSFKGFVHKEGELFMDLVYGGMGMEQWLILRTAVNDGHSYETVNQVIWINDDYSPVHLNKPEEYDESLYDRKKVKLWHKQLNIEQVCVFAGLVNGIIREIGIENLSNEVIFNNEDVRSILGLNLDGPYEYTPATTKNPTQKQNS